MQAEAILMNMEEAEVKNPVAVALAALRNQKVSPERRREIARLAAERRWGKQKRTKAK